MVVENTITKCLAMKSVLGVDYTKLEKTTSCNPLALFATRHCSRDTQDSTVITLNVLNLVKR